MAGGRPVEKSDNIFAGTTAADNSSKDENPKSESIS
jgi:hypothetical protein